MLFASVVFVTIVLVIFFVPGVRESVLGWLNLTCLKIINAYPSIGPIFQAFRNWVLLPLATIAALALFFLIAFLFLTILMVVCWTMEFNDMAGILAIVLSLMAVTMFMVSRTVGATTRLFRDSRLGVWTFGSSNRYYTLGEFTYSLGLLAMLFVFIAMVAFWFPDLVRENPKWILILSLFGFTAWLYTAVTASTQRLAPKYLFSASAIIVFVATIGTLFPQLTRFTKASSDYASTKTAQASVKVESAADFIRVNVLEDALLYDCVGKKVNTNNPKMIVRGTTLKVIGSKDPLVQNGQKMLVVVEADAFGEYVTKTENDYKCIAVEKTEYK